MDRELANVHEHMRELGLGALAHANWHANYLSLDNKWWSELAVLQAAHAAEILIKARIAEEHPLLIFEQLPKITPESGTSISLEHMIEGGRTYQFSELPDRLWAATGMQLPNIVRYRSFGRLRNTIQHFAVPITGDAGIEAVRFIYEVIDPFINQCWELYAIDFNEDHEPHVYLVEGLIRRGIRFMVSPEAASSLEYIDQEWPPDMPDYKAEMLARFKAAATHDEL